MSALATGARNRLPEWLQGPRCPETDLRKRECGCRRCLSEVVARAVRSDESGRVGPSQGYKNGSRGPELCEESGLTKPECACGVCFEEQVARYAPEPVRRLLL